MGHAMKGKKFGKERLMRMAEGLRRAWADPGKFLTMRHQSEELIRRRIGPLVGRHISEEQKRAISRANTGRKLSEAHRLASSKQWFTGPKNLEPEIEKRRRKGISEARKGCHNYGRAARDRLDHFNALHWIIRDTRGVIHEFDNLQSWCRANEWRFLPDARPKSKLPLWFRAVSGFNNQQRMDGKATHQWRGWTLVSVLERKEQGAPDLLERKISGQ